MRVLAPKNLNRNVFARLKLYSIIYTNNGRAPKNYVTLSRISRVFFLLHRFTYSAFASFQWLDAIEEDCSDLLVEDGAPEGVGPTGSFKEVVI